MRIVLMLKKIFGLCICFSVLMFFAMPSADAAFAWFGFRNENTEVMVNSTSDDCHHHWFNHPPKKHKPKPHPKHHPHKKGPKHNKWWWHK